MALAINPLFPPFVEGGFLKHRLHLKQSSAKINTANIALADLPSANIWLFVRLGMTLRNVENIIEITQINFFYMALNVFIPSLKTVILKVILSVLYVIYFIPFLIG